MALINLECKEKWGGGGGKGTKMICQNKKWAVHCLNTIIMLFSTTQSEVYTVRTVSSKTGFYYGMGKGDYFSVNEVQCIE